MQSSKSEPRPHRRWRGNLLALTLLVCLGGLAYYLTHRAAWANASDATAPSASDTAGKLSDSLDALPVMVGTASVRQSDIPLIIEALGTVTPAALITVTPLVSGVLTQVKYKEGQMVEKGDELATIDPRPFEIALAQAEGARARDLAQLNAARALLERYRALLQQDSIARQTVDTQEALVQQLAATVDLDQANTDSAKLNLQWTRIVAPVSGRVGLRAVDAGNYVAAGAGKGIATITRVSPIDVAFSIPQNRVPELQQRVNSGDILPVTAWDSNRLVQLDSGTFSTIDNQIDTATGTVKAKAHFQNAGGALFPNQFVNVRLLLGTAKSATVVPVTALRHGPNGDFVYVVNSDRVVSLRSVKADLFGVNEVAIASGLTLGEQVVTEGGDRLRDGMHVKTSPNFVASPDHGDGQPATHEPLTSIH